MRKYPLVLVLAVPTLLAFAPAPKPKDDPKDDLKKLQGTWKLSKLELGGKESVSKALVDMKAVIEKDQWAFERAGGRLSPMTLVLDPKTKPKSFKFKRKLASGEERVTSEGIYTLEKDKLTISYGPAGSKAGPKDASVRRITMTFQREK
jgi:uncharacterized protein (TIGR03067 family)